MAHNKQFFYFKLALPVFFHINGSPLYWKVSVSLYTLNEIYYRDLQFVWAESWLLESSSVGDVLQYLVILDTRIGTATETEHLPTCHSIGPLERGQGRGRRGGGEKEREEE